MLDLVAIAQSAPGAIAVNGAIVVGYKLAGIAGALAAIIGTIIPPFVILSVIFLFLCGILFQLYCKNGAGRHAGGRRSGHCVGCL